MRVLAIPVLLSLVAGCAGLVPQSMTQARLEALIAAQAQDVEGDPGAIRFRFDGVGLVCLSDPARDRMRIMAPVVKLSELTKEEVAGMLKANYYSALDARYATSSELVFAVYMHPLSSLTEAELRSALQQVARLVQTFGSTYSSSDLIYREE